jgi:ubiquinone biosynthesis protein
MIRAFRNSCRLLHVVRVLGRHGVLPEAYAPPALRPALALFQRRPAAEAPGFGRRLADALQELGPSYVKFGQSLAVRSDLIGEAAAEELSQLQDKLPPFPGDQAIAIIERELDRSIEALFTRFDIEPIAAASIAQVHLAETPEGARVAVKVLRPGIEAEFAKDIDLFAWIAGLTERLAPSLARFRPRAVVAQVEAVVARELDLRLEAASASALADAAADDEGFRVPAVDWTRTGERVLTIEWIDGIRIDDLEKLDAAGLDRREIVRKSAVSFFNQVFRDGFFHADMHPGNMFVTEDGTLAPVDFGIMGHLDRATRYYLADMLMAFLERDYGKVAAVHFEAGLVPADQSRDAFALAIRSVCEPIIGLPMQEISIARLLARLLKTAEDFDMAVQPQLLLLQKTMLVAEGVGRKLDPDSNMWVLARPLIESWMRRYRGPEARLQEGLSEMAAAFRRIPGMIVRADDLLQRIERDREAAAKRRAWFASGFGCKHRLGWWAIFAGFILLTMFIITK